MLMEKKVCDGLLKNVYLKALSRYLNWWFSINRMNNKVEDLPIRIRKTYNSAF